MTTGNSPAPRSRYPGEMNDGFRVRSIPVPALMYGTAWKEERTESLVRQALAAGFTAIDTANQRKHYHEAGVGAALAASGMARGDLFLQTKFTYVRGQDHRLPYDPKADIGTQVLESFQSSCQHLGVTMIDSYVLHGPWAGQGWSAQDRAAWAAMEGLHRDGSARLLGISNVSLQQLELLCGEARIKPAMVQNRCYARTGWDAAVRALCAQHDITYQGFSLLTANTRELVQAPVRELAGRLHATVPQVVFAFARAVGMIALTGTSDVQHMREDLAAGGFALTPADVELMRDIGA